MNQRDRVFIDRLDRVIREVGSLIPANPADVLAVSSNLRIATAAGKDLSRAIAAARAGDWDAVRQHLDRADAIVARPTTGRRACQVCGRSGGELMENGCPSCGPNAEIVG